MSSRVIDLPLCCLLFVSLGIVSEIDSELTVVWAEPWVEVSFGWGKVEMGGVLARGGIVLVLA